MTPTPKPALTISDETARRPTVSLRWRDLVARRSEPREQAITHYGAKVAPWGIVAIFVGGMVAGLWAGTIRQFLDNQAWATTGGWLQACFDAVASSAILALMVLVAARATRLPE